MTNHKEEVREYFTQTGDYWRNVYDESRLRNKWASYWMRQRASIVMEFVKACAGSRALTVLDVGCGPGFLLEELAGQGHEAVGVDINPSMVRAARETVGKPARGEVYYLVSDCERLPFGNDRFDVILCVGVLQYLEKDAACLRELCRVAKPGGRIIITLPSIHRLANFLDPGYVFGRGFRYLLSRRKKKAAADPGSPEYAKFGLNISFLNRRYRWGQLRPVFRDCGLKEIATAAVAYSPPSVGRKPIISYPLSCRLSARLEKRSRTRGFHWLTALADRWVICLEKPAKDGPA